MSRRSEEGRLPRRLSPRQVRLLSAAVVLQLLASLLGLVVVDPAPSSAPSSDVRARVAPSESLLTPPADVEAARTAAVQRLLRVRGDAVMTRDRAAFLATVDPAAQELLARETAMFDALAEVPLASWTYDLDARSTQRPSPVIDARHGVGRWWAPEVSLRYSIAGFDDTPTYARQVLTFVERDGRWLVGADDDFEPRGDKTARALWDTGPVIAVRGTATLVLGRPDERALLQTVAEAVDAAVPRVTEVWGPDWKQAVVVLVPGSQEELSQLLGGRSDLGQIAAVATAEIVSSDSGTTAVGDRVILNPPNFAQLGEVGRQVVLAHEVAHVAMRRVSGTRMPVWLAEGLADYIGYHDTDVPVTVAAREVRADVQAGQLPQALPSNRDFDGSNPKLAAAYEQSWLAVSLLVETYGIEAVLRFYRAVGADPEGGAEALETSFRSVLGTTTGTFTGEWQQYLQRRLG